MATRGSYVHYLYAPENSRGHPDNVHSSLYWQFSTKINGFDMQFKLILQEL